MDKEPQGEASLAATARKVSPTMTVKRDGQELCVYKRTYLSEAQQLDEGKTLPASRLAKITAASKQARQEVVRAAKRSIAEALPGCVDSAELDTELSELMLRLGSVVALATRTEAGVYAWWAGRVEKMQVKSAKGKFVDAKEPMPLDEARRGLARVICTWYRKHARYVFTYDGPIDDEVYSMKNALGLLDLELPDSQSKYRLRDSSQGPQLDAALELTKPAHGKKRTQGEELVAREAQYEREHATPEGERIPTAAVIRATGKRRVLTRA